MIKVRAEGLLDDINKLTKIFESNDKIKILSKSEPYKNRGNNYFYRIYIDADLKEE